MSLPMPDTGRITLTLTTRTIKALRLLALLKDASQNQVAEDLLIAGGLHHSVDSQWNAGKPADAPVSLPEPPAPPMTTHASKAAPVPTALLHKPAAAPIHHAAPAPVKPAPIAIMPEVVDDTEVSPYMKDEDEPSPYKY